MEGGAAAAGGPLVECGDLYAQKYGKLVSIDEPVAVKEG
jgi:hypothetical protein